MTVQSPSQYDTASPQRPSSMPIHKYRPYAPVDLADRRWPSRAIERRIST